jgi:hypothetical protein
MKKQFEVWRYNFPGRGEHPCVIISHPDIAARSQFVNILFCTSRRQNRPPKLTEVTLDTADGMDWETFVNCSAMWLVESADLFANADKSRPHEGTQFATNCATFFACPPGIKTIPYI